MTTSGNNEKCGILPVIHLAEAFADTEPHLAVAEIIRKYISNNEDIREFALRSLNLDGAKKILDLGCGNGFFTTGLRNKTHPDASVNGIDLHAQYKELFLKTCAQTGLKGAFSGQGISKIRNMEPGQYDLVLCSYALNFFPEYVKCIPKVMKADGFFVAIVHSDPHLRELICMVKETLGKMQPPWKDLLPYEQLITNFSDRTGFAILSPLFRKIQIRPYPCKMVFKPGDTEDFVRYFRYKKRFYLPAGYSASDKAVDSVLNRFRQVMSERGEVSISKDDTVYVCSEPVVHQNR